MGSEAPTLRSSVKPEQAGAPEWWSGGLCPPSGLGPLQPCMAVAGAVQTPDIILLQEGADVVDGVWALTSNRPGPKSSLLHVPTVLCPFVSLSLNFPTCQMGA